MALDITILTNYMEGLIPNPTSEQQAQIVGLANAIKAFVQSAQINYTSGLISPSGAVTGTFVGNLT